MPSRCETRVLVMSALPKQTAVNETSVHTYPALTLEPEQWISDPWLGSQSSNIVPKLLECLEVLGLSEPQLCTLCTSLATETRLE